MTLYQAGTVTVANGSIKVYGRDTDWLANSIKPTDLFYLENKLYEIESVNSGTEIILSRGYAGTSAENVTYTIIRIAPQVISADLALLIQQLVANYNAREAELASKIEAHEPLVNVIKKARLYIDTDGNLAQSDEITPASTIIIDGEEAQLTTSENIQELVNELGWN